MEADVTLVEPTPPAVSLTGREKAAIVVRMLLAEGMTLPLAELPNALQGELTRQLVSMRFVDRRTLAAVVEEFAEELEDVGVVFPGGIDAALSLLDGIIAPDLAARLRRQTDAVWDDPWDAVSIMSAEKLARVLRGQSIEVGAVVLSRLPVAKAAQILHELPGPLARRLSLVVAESSTTTQDVVHRIGVVLASELKAEPPPAFVDDAAKRLGKILNQSPKLTRTDLMAGLEEEDPELAAKVRAAIFVFSDIPNQVPPAAVMEIAQEVESDDLITVIAASRARVIPAIDYLLEHLPKRRSQALKDEAEGMPDPDEEDVEEAERRIAKRIQDLSDEGKINLSN